MRDHGRTEGEPIDAEGLHRQDRVGYDPLTQTYYAQYGGERSAGLTAKVVRFVAAITGETPLELEPLYTVIDPEALEGLFDNARNNPDEHEGMYVTFEFESCQITVSWGGEIRVKPSNEASTRRREAADVE